MKRIANVDIIGSIIDERIRQLKWAISKCGDNILQYELKVRLQEVEYLLYRIKEY